METSVADSQTTVYAGASPFFPLGDPAPRGTGGQAGPGGAPCPDGDPCPGYVATAVELLETLKVEAQILRRFAGDELMALLPKKECLVNELEWELKSTGSGDGGSTPVSGSFKALFDEIRRLNTSNGVFIEKSLCFWRDLLAALAPGSYERNGRKSGLPGMPRGRTFEREI